MKSKFKTIHKPQKDKFCVLVGTRPGIIKMSPLIKEFDKRKARYFVIHAGQHYSYNMDKKFFEDLGLKEPEYKLKSVKKYHLHGSQTAEMLKGIEEILIKEEPGTVLVCGDANVNLAGALAARKLGLKVGHVESGLRSNDWRMPEEHNRVIIDHISDYLFAPTEEAKYNAINDNVKGEVYVTGNTIVDAVIQHIEIAKKKSSILNKLNIRSKKYCLLTIHREENVDHIDILINVIQGLKLIHRKYQLPIIFPIHPRTRKSLEVLGVYNDLIGIQKLEIVDPVGYLDFLLLLSETKLVLTDSGGIQEESCILRVPCVTLRENTERRETVEVGSNMLVGTSPERIIEGVDKMIKRVRSWDNPFGDGFAAKRIIDIVMEESI